MSPPLATAPALPLHTAGPYVAAAYIVFVALILVYVGIMARRLAGTERELARLRRELEARGASGAEAGPGATGGAGRAGDLEERGPQAQPEPMERVT